MKQKHILIAAFTALIFGSLITTCSKTASLLNKTFTFSTPAQSFVIPPVPDSIALVSGYMPAVTGSFSYNLDSFIKANTGGVLGIANISILKLNNCLLTDTNPDSLSNFRDFQSLTVSFTATSTSSSYVISATQPDVYAATMTLMPNDTSASMAPYLSGSTFNYSVKGQMRHGTADSMKCNAVFTFTVNVQG